MLLERSELLSRTNSFLHSLIKSLSHLKQKKFFPVKNLSKENVLDMNRSERKGKKRQLLNI